MRAAVVAGKGDGGLSDSKDLRRRRCPLRERTAVPSESEVAEIDKWSMGVREWQ